MSINYVDHTTNNIYYYLDLNNYVDHNKAGKKYFFLIFKEK